MSPKPFRFKVKKGESPIGTSWTYEVFRDKLLLEATLFNAAAHLDGLYKRPASTMSLRHRGNTISIVNKMLDSPDKASDSIIGAVALMAFSGVCAICHMLIFRADKALCIRTAVEMSKK
jgi:hypothetical protein